MKRAVAPQDRARPEVLARIRRRAGKRTNALRKAQGRDVGARRLKQKRRGE
jgi:hypothetical protein